MSEKSTQFFDSYLKDIPTEIRPFARSLVVSRIAAHQEKPYDPKVAETWMINSQLINEEISTNLKDKVGVRDRAIWLATLPEHQDEQTEWYFRWLRGNGLSILADPRMRATLNTLIDDQKKSQPLVDALSSFLKTDVAGLDQKTLSDAPESYSLFASFLIVDNLGYGSLTEKRKHLINQAEERLINDGEMNKVMDIFGVFEETKPLFERFNTYRQEARDAAKKQ